MGKVIWFTGLSGSGKTTIAERLKKELDTIGKTVDILDGDIIRNTLNTHLGFSREDIRENNRKIAEFACEKDKEADFVLVAVMAPYKEDRTMIRSIIGTDFIEVFVNAPLKKCMERDVKGLYKKALAGKIKNFVGLSESNPYEVPINPDFELNTESLSLNESLNQMMVFLKNKKLL